MAQYGSKEWWAIERDRRGGWTIGITCPHCLKAVPAPEWPADSDECRCPDMEAIDTHQLLRELGIGDMPDWMMSPVKITSGLVQRAMGVTP